MQSITPIICLEGASAVGKTTTANCFKASDGVFIVPEVNLLFEKRENASAEWYFERQVERWQIAQEQSAIHRLVILDGDPFQPLWYSWAYNFLGWQSLDFMEQFYQPKIQNKTLGFPDRYFIFSANEAELRERKDRDTTRQRRGFETHLRMIEPQRRYFQAMQKISPRRVRFLEAKTVETNVEFIQEDVSGSANFNEIEAGTLFKKMVEWLRENEA
jgi:thymidylate kinase